MPITLALSCLEEVLEPSKSRASGQWYGRWGKGEWTWPLPIFTPLSSILSLLRLSKDTTCDNNDNPGMEDLLYIAAGGHFKSSESCESVP